MKRIKADLHIHTVLSPCGDLEMSPAGIVARAVEENLGMVGITDHNSLRQIAVIEKLAAREGIFVLGGVEITTREEVHCLAFFPGIPEREAFQRYIDQYQPVIPNKDGAFGYQVVVDEQEKITEMVEKLLITGLHCGINDIEREVHRLGGLFIPAHIDRSVNSIFSQLGFLPPRLQVDALEITCYITENEARRQFNLPENVTLIRDSDAHYPADIGKGYSLVTLEECSFEEFRLALAGIDGRGIRTGEPFRRT